MAEIKASDSADAEGESRVKAATEGLEEAGIKVDFVLDGRIPVSIVPSVRNQIALALLSSEFEYEGLELESAPQRDILKVNLDEGSVKASHINKLINRLEGAIEESSADVQVRDVDISVAPKA